jgi:hypothetical protein
MPNRICSGRSARLVRSPDRSGSRRTFYRSVSAEAALSRAGAPIVAAADLERSEGVALISATLRGVVVLAARVGDDDPTTAVGQALLMAIRLDARRG